MAKTPKKAAVSSGKTTAGKENAQQPAAEGDRKINPWIPIAVVSFIIALIAIMAAMSNSSTNTTGDNGTTAASGTTQSGSAETETKAVDTSWITLETTATQVSEQTGIPAKMLQQFLGIKEADMNKPFSQLGGQEAVDKAASLVAQFGGGGMGGSTGGTGGTTSP
ncbi:MAG: hypothetical protein WC891_06585 [Actinomycetota bacterium]